MNNDCDFVELSIHYCSFFEADGGGFPVALPPLPRHLLVHLGEGLLAQRDPVPHLYQGEQIIQ
jgi:hypothetical protein